MTYRTSVLQIMIGVDAAIGDPVSAELGARVLPLILDNTDTGFTRRPTDDWWPNIAALKQGQAWSDTSTRSGRQLKSDAVDNVQETVTLLAVGNTYAALYERLSHLNRFVSNARRFMVHGYEIEPVYLHWRAVGNEVDQYALIYDIDVSIRELSSNNSAHPMAEVVIVVEREPAWRWVVPPGGNPKLWTYFSRGMYPGRDFDYSAHQMALDIRVGADNDLVRDDVQQRHEFDHTDYYAAPISKPWIDIDAELIPGDAPALACAAYTTRRVRSDVSEYTATFMNSFHIARSTRPRFMLDKSGQLRPQFNVLNAADGTTADKTLDASATLWQGPISNNTANNYYVAPATNSHNIVWGSGVGSFYRLNYNSFRGKWAAFARIGVAPDPGATAQLDIRPARAITWTLFSEQGLNAIRTLNRNPYDMAYMGIVQFPPDRESSVSRFGRGLDAFPMSMAENGDFELRLRVTYPAGTTSRFIHDVFFMPVDETYLIARVPNVQTTNINYANPVWESVVVDSTGYLGRARSTQAVAVMAQSEDTAGGAEFIPQWYDLVSELVGGDLTLLPNTDNRLYVMYDRYNIGAGVGVNGVVADTNQAGEIGINIVPRSYGVAAWSR